MLSSVEKSKKIMTKLGKLTGHDVELVFVHLDDVALIDDADEFRDPAIGTMTTAALTAAEHSLALLASQTINHLQKIIITRMKRRHL